MEEAWKESGEAQEQVMEQEEEVTALHDLLAGGIAGTASVIVGHPFDTIKVRLQTSAPSSSSSSGVATQKFGGFSSLFRGMGAPLSAAAVINALIFSAFGESSRVWDEYFSVEPPTPPPPPIIKQEEGNFFGWGKKEVVVAHHAEPNEHGITKHHPDHPDHQAWQKSVVCGSFAGFVQAIVICPMEHVKCRLQIQHGRGAVDFRYQGPRDAVRQIVRGYGLQGLYRGWWITFWREVPAFGLYFATYDTIKENINRRLTTAEERLGESDDFNHVHRWAASAMAGGISGCTTWAIIYPLDVIKTRIQTSSLDRKFSMVTVGKDLVTKHGWRILFRGLGVTLVRAFPVNGIIFPVYEFSLQQMTQSQYF